MKQSKKQLKLHKDTIRDLTREESTGVSGGNTSGPRCPQETHIDWGPTICPVYRCQEQTAVDC